MPRHRLLTSTTALMGAVLAATLVWSAPARAQSGQVYRCGDTYQQVPCESGKAVDVADTRDAKQQKDAAAALAKDQQTAEKLRQERLARDKATPVQTAPAGITPAPLAKPEAAAGDRPECKLPPGHGRKPAHGKARKDCQPLPTVTSPKPPKAPKADTKKDAR